MSDVIPDFSEVELGGVETAKASPEELEKVMAADVDPADPEGPGVGWMTPEGIDVKPAYTSKETDDLDFLDTKPGF